MLHLHRSERADALAGALADVLADPLEDPFEREVVAVPTRGIERWLSQRLAATLGAMAGRADGVCANVTFPFPERLLAAALDAARPPALATAASAASGAGPAGGSGPAATRPAGALALEPPQDPWSPGRAVWPLIEVVEECSGEAWLELLVAHVERGGGRQRFAALRHVADLFDRYAVHRPAMIRAWAGGLDTDGSGAPLAPDLDLAWQPELWRRLRRRIGEPSSAERLEDACAALRAGEVVVDLPLRVSLFGLTRLPPSYLEVLQAIAARRDVHLFLLHPSPALWAGVAGAGPLPASTLMRRRDDPTAELARHPLLASWGRDAREMQLVLRAGEGAAREPAVDGHYHPSPTPSGATLLARIQSDLRDNRRPPGQPAPGGPDERLVLGPGDDSIQVHDCHGRSRQVEVVRDAILHLLADDLTLEPRDVIVMCPDIESWAPLIRAAFDVASAPAPSGPPTRPGGAPAGSAEAANDEAEGQIDLRARLADRSLRQTNPLLGVVSVLLTLAGSRATASQVLDLAAMPPVRRRFAFDDAELARLRQWVGESGVRWGLDAAHRAPYGLEMLTANSWRSGLDRVLLGIAVSEEERRLVGGVLPLEDVASNDVDLAGRFGELVERLTTTLDELTPADGGLERLPVGGWAEILRRALDRLALCSEPERWQRLQVDRLLAEVADEAAGDDRPGAASPGAPGAPSIGLAELRSLLADRLRGRPTRANFRTGHLTICTLVPMRSVPHRVVCLLGMDDGAFPRRGTEDGDDLVSRDPCVGDRDPKSEDRQLLLDALLAAGEHLVVTYRGRDERTNALRPPCVPIGELLDLIDATARVDLPGELGAASTAAAAAASPGAASAGVASPGADPVGSASQRVLVHHPLQPFDARCFTPGALVPSAPWSFDPVNLAGARAAAAPRSRRPPFLAAPLPSLDEEVTELAGLVRFVRRPVGEFLRRRLGLRLGEDSEEPLDALPITLDPLAAHAVGERLLAGRLAGLDRAACEAAERARGSLPPGLLAEQELRTRTPTVEALLAAWHEVVPGGAERRTLDVRVVLGDGSLVVGSVAGVHGNTLSSIAYSRLSPARRLQAFVQLVACAATDPAVAGAVTIGRAAARGGDDDRIALSRLEAGEDPLALLEVLVELYRGGMREPLPLYCRTSEAFAAARRRQETDPWRAARFAWRGSGGASSHGEADDEEHVLVLGAVELDDLLADPLRAGESGTGWPEDEPTRLGRYSRRLWDPLLGRERLEER